MMNTDDVKEELLKRKIAVETLRQLEGEINNHPLTEELLKALVDRVKSSINYNNGIKDETKRSTLKQIILDPPYCSPCGCMGPQDGDPFCGCVMRNLQYVYRYDVAIALRDEIDLSQLV